MESAGSYGFGLSPVADWEAAKAATDIATMPCRVLEKTLQKSLTDNSQDHFLKDWEHVKSQVLWSHANPSVQLEPWCKKKT